MILAHLSQDFLKKMRFITFNSFVHPEKSPRLLLRLEDLSIVMSFCEEEMEVFIPRTWPNHFNASNVFVLINI